MTELSDYRRLVESPMIANYRATIASLRSRAEAAEANARRLEGVVSILTRALAAWHRAFDTGRSEPLFSARDHSSREVVDLLFPDTTKEADR